MKHSTEPEDFSTVEATSLPENLDTIIDNPYLFDLDDQVQHWRDSMYTLVGEEQE